MHHISLMQRQICLRHMALLALWITGRRELSASYQPRFCNQGKFLWRKSSEDGRTLWMQDFTILQSHAHFAGRKIPPDWLLLHQLLPPACPINNRWTEVYPYQQHWCNLSKKQRFNARLMYMNSDKQLDRSGITVTGLKKKKKNSLEAKIWLNSSDNIIQWLLLYILGVFKRDFKVQTTDER